MGGDESLEVNFQIFYWSSITGMPVICGGIVMEIAVMADIHGNYEALKRCTRYALERGIGTFIFLGDYLGELAYPERTMDYLYQLKKDCRCIFVRGNKEEYWLNYKSAGETGWRECDSTTGTLYETYRRLTPRDLEFFEGMEPVRSVCLENRVSFTICHGSPRGCREKMLPDSPCTYEIMEQDGTGLILCAHTHIQRKIVHKGMLALNPGSVGVPLKSGGKTQFLILREDGSGWQEEFLSLAYPVEAEIANMYHAGLMQKAPYWSKITEHLLRTGQTEHSLVLEKAMAYCREEQGECVWPDIPESCWKRAYESFFGQ